MPVKEHKLFTSLARQLARLPGLGPRSARRALLHLLNHREEELNQLITHLQMAFEQVIKCQECGALDFVNPCLTCTDHNRDTTKLCVVEQMSDLWAIERSGIYKGLYHVLGGVLSPLDGVTPDHLNLGSLQNRCRNKKIGEVILATNITLDGQTTAHYIAEILSPLVKEYSMTITRVAHGVPAGGELDYMDEGTLFAAFKARKHLD
ncbi:MAG: recombination mediator RecR [Alphaproteobacteria bacterium]